MSLFPFVKVEVGYYREDLSEAIFIELSAHRCLDSLRHCLEGRLPWPFALLDQLEVGLELQEEIE